MMILLVGLAPVKSVHATENLDAQIAAVVDSSMPPTTIAQTDEKVLTAHEIARQQIKQVIESETFNQKEQSFRYEFRNQSDDEPEAIKTDGFSSLWYWMAKLFSLIIEFALWVFLAIIVIFLLTRYRHLILGLKVPEKTARVRPKKLFGLDMNSDDLPDNPWQVALDLLERQQFREATSLLYRASLIWYIDHTKVVIKEGDTELECLSKVTTAEIKASAGLRPSTAR